LWTSAVALFGGMLAAMLQLDLSLNYFIENLPRAVPVANLLIGLGKGLVFGFVIALIACYFGLRVKPNTESLSANTTTAVVTAITMVILIDAIFAVLTRHIGLPEL
jgi:phospholipid/cholesterol/gamma-HCH transport system permease protein